MFTDSEDQIPLEMTTEITENSSWEESSIDQSRGSGSRISGSDEYSASEQSPLATGNLQMRPSEANRPEMSRPLSPEIWNLQSSSSAINERCMAAQDKDDAHETGPNINERKDDVVRITKRNMGVGNEIDKGFEGMNYSIHETIPDMFGSKGRIASQRDSWSVKVGRKVNHDLITLNDEAIHVIVRDRVAQNADDGRETYRGLSTQDEKVGLQTDRYLNAQNRDATAVTRREEDTQNGEVAHETDKDLGALRQDATEVTDRDEGEQHGDKLRVAERNEQSRPVQVVPIKDHDLDINGDESGRRTLPERSAPRLVLPMKADNAGKDRHLNLLHEAVASTSKDDTVQRSGGNGTLTSEKAIPERKRKERPDYPTPGSADLPRRFLERLAADGRSSSLEDVKDLWEHLSGRSVEYRKMIPDAVLKTCDECVDYLAALLPKEKGNDMAATSTTAGKEEVKSVKEKSASPVASSQDQCHQQSQTATETSEPSIPPEEFLIELVGGQSADSDTALSMWKHYSRTSEIFTDELPEAVVLATSSLADCAVKSGKDSIQDSDETGKEHHISGSDEETDTDSNSSVSPLSSARCEPASEDENTAANCDGRQEDMDIPTDSLVESFVGGQSKIKKKDIPLLKHYLGTAQKFQGVISKAGLSHWIDNMTQYIEQNKTTTALDSENKKTSTTPTATSKELSRNPSVSKNRMHTDSSSGTEDEIPENPMGFEQGPSRDQPQNQRRSSGCFAASSALDSTRDTLPDYVEPPELYLKSLAFKDIAGLQHDVKDMWRQHHNQAIKFENKMSSSLYVACAEMLDNAKEKYEVPHRGKSEDERTFDIHTATSRELLQHLLPSERPMCTDTLPEAEAEAEAEEEPECLKSVEREASREQSQTDERSSEFLASQTTLDTLPGCEEPLKPFLKSTTSKVISPVLDIEFMWKHYHSKAVKFEKEMSSSIYAACDEMLDEMEVPIADTDVGSDVNANVDTDGVSESEDESGSLGDESGSLGGSDDDKRSDPVTFYNIDTNQAKAVKFEKEMSSSIYAACGEMLDEMEVPNADTDVESDVNANVETRGVGESEDESGSDDDKRSDPVTFYDFDTSQGLSDEIYLNAIDHHQGLITNEEYHKMMKAFYAGELNDVGEDKSLLIFAIEMQKPQDDGCSQWTYQDFSNVRESDGDSDDCDPPTEDKYSIARRMRQLDWHLYVLVLARWIQVLRRRKVAKREERHREARRNIGEVIPAANIRPTPLHLRQMSRRYDIVDDSDDENYEPHSRNKEPGKMREWHPLHTEDPRLMLHDRSPARTTIRVSSSRRITASKGTSDDKTNAWNNRGKTHTEIQREESAPGRSDLNMFMRQAGIIDGLPSAKRKIPRVVTRKHFTRSTPHRDGKNFRRARTDVYGLLFRIFGVLMISIILNIGLAQFII